MFIRLLTEVHSQKSFDSTLLPCLNVPDVRCEDPWKINYKKTSGYYLSLSALPSESSQGLSSPSTCRNSVGIVLKLKLSASKIQEIKPTQRKLQYVVTWVQQSTCLCLCVACNRIGLEKSGRVLVPGRSQCHVWDATSSLTSMSIRGAVTFCSSQARAPSWLILRCGHTAWG